MTQVCERGLSIVFKPTLLSMKSFAMLLCDQQILSLATMQSVLGFGCWESGHSALPHAKVELSRGLFPASGYVEVLPRPKSAATMRDQLQQSIALAHRAGRYGAMT